MWHSNPRHFLIKMKFDITALFFDTKIKKQKLLSIAAFKCFYCDTSCCWWWCYSWISIWHFNLLSSVYKNQFVQSNLHQSKSVVIEKIYFYGDEDVNNNENFSTRVCEDWGSGSLKIPLSLDEQSALKHEGNISSR